MNKLEFITIPPMNHKLVICRADKPMELYKLIKKNKKILTWLKKKKLGRFELDGGEDAITLNNEATGSPCLAAFFKKMPDIDVIHETNHLVFDLAKYYGFEDEPEFNAYLQTWLYNEIIKKLK